ncbi:sensor histidine kinase [Kitasatospora sp. NPDC057198]|uniref:sensor histidine kinase n=1 Tax=Kitasatospora sp. NPDC057198 TaxID=3346046 RepID=UPI0036277A2B
MTEAAATHPPRHRPRRLPAAARESLPPLLALPPLLLHAAATQPSARLPVAAALTCALVLPLAWRHRAPRAAFGAVAAAALVQWLTDVQLPADAALLVALHAVAGYAGRRAALTACAVAEGGALLACLRWAAPDAFLAPFVALSATVLAAATLGRHARTARAHLALAEQRQEQRARLAVAEERARIAREVHDIVTHHLSVMVALTDAALHAQHRAPEKATTAMRGAAETGRRALTDMRRSLGLLRTGTPDGPGAPDGPGDCDRPDGPDDPDDPDARRHPLPGIAELAALADRMRAAGLPVRVELDGEHAALPATVQLTVHRLVQEALTNTFKHAPAGTRAEVRVHCSAATVTVRVTDDNPAALPAPPDPPGRGLTGMHERAAAHGGTLRAGPRPGGGWEVRARLPLTGYRRGVPA